MSDYSINAIELGNRIRALRQKQNKTQSYFADMLFISPSYLALIESGKRIPNLDVLVQIARLGDVSLDFLILGEDTVMDPIQKTFDRLRSTYSQDAIQNALRLAEYYLLLSEQTDHSAPISV